MQIADYIDADLLDKFEFHNYNHAIEIITQAFPEEWREVVECLRKLDITTDDLREAGGNETKIPKKFDDVLYPYGWREIRISGDLHIKFYPRQADQRGRFSSVPFEERVTENYIDGHNIDFLKGRIAFDLEWNSKDQTFDRDLLAMRTYYDCDIVSAGIIALSGFILFNTIFALLYLVGKMAGKRISTKCKYMVNADDNYNQCQSCGDGYCTKECAEVSIACRIFHKYS